MSPFDEELRRQYPDYDLDIVEESVAALVPQEPFSQAREAQKLRPLIAKLLAIHPKARGTAIADMLAAARREGTEALGPTFRREVGTIVHAIRAAPVEQASVKSNDKRHTNKRQSVAVGGAGAIAAAAITAPAPSAQAAPSQMEGRTSIASGSSVSRSGERPYRYTGRFAGKTFTHGIELRNFFSAVEKGQPLESIAALVAPVLASPAARVRLGELAPDDRAIFEAMARWMKANDS